jgi:tetratricopeptide (TPR) repeat protein
MNLTGKNISFRKLRPNSNPYRMVIWGGLLIAALFVLRGIDNREIKKPFLPTPVPTRISQSYALEGETHFVAGDLNKAIQAYVRALEVDPKNATLWAELARIQTYSSASITTDAQRRTRLEEALVSADKGVELAPDSSIAHAMRAFVLDWYANPVLVGDKAQELILQAEQEAVTALQLDNQNTLALAFYAEILIDQYKYIQAEQVARQALERDETLMDVHRVYGYVMENMMDYGEAINQYKKAVEITPNLTFLYISIGVNYRQLKQYQLALDYFAKAASINKQLSIEDPIPYLAIGKTYSQTGDFLAAAQNVRKALAFDPSNPDVYGSLGMVYFKSRNYEGAIEALKCAVRGCNPEESCKVSLCDSAADRPITIAGLPLSDTTVVYYYTYASALAGMHRPKTTNCDEALLILKDVRNNYSGEPVIMQIVEGSEQVCASFGYTVPLP